MSIVKQSAILYLYEDHHGLLLETCYPVPTQDVIDRTLKEGMSVSVIARDTNYKYTWYPDMRCKCEFGNGVKIEWWRRPTLKEIITNKNGSMFYQIYSDGSVATRDRFGKIYNYGSLEETMVIHGEVIEESIYPVCTETQCYCDTRRNYYEDEDSYHYSDDGRSYHY